MPMLTVVFAVPWEPSTKVPTPNTKWVNKSGAKQPDLVKIRWLGPAHVVMKEYKKEGTEKKVHVYWLAYKSQLIRCAPHHIRADVNPCGRADGSTLSARSSPEASPGSTTSTA